MKDKKIKPPFKITVNLYPPEDTNRGDTAWAWSVDINGGTHKVGYGKDFDSAAHLGKLAVGSATRWLGKGQPEVN